MSWFTRLFGLGDQRRETPGAAPLAPPSDPTPAPPAAEVPAAAPAPGEAASRPPYAFSAALPLLAEPHSAFGGYSWRLDRDGVNVDGQGVLRTEGDPATARRTLEWYLADILAAAEEMGVPVELLIACLCAESTGGAKSKDAATFCIRREPGFVDSEATPSKVSTGPMQLLLSTAREILGRPSLRAEDLYDPATSLRAGAAYIASQAMHTRFDPPLVGAAYNAGSVRKDPAGTNPWQLVCYPMGTGAHVDRFTRFFNDAIAVIREGPGPIGTAPSFEAALRRS